MTFWGKLDFHILKNNNEAFNDMMENNQDAESRDVSESNTNQTLAQKLKAKGWVIIVADWCGYCGKQKDFFNDNPDLGFNDVGVNGLVVNEKDLSDDHEYKRNVQGFPSCQQYQNGKMVKNADGYKDSVEEFLKLLKNL